MLKTIKALALAGAMISCASVSQAQTPASQGTFVDVPGGKLWYETCGSGPQAMVLIHDGFMPSVTWEDVWPALCKTFHVIRYDRRGYGRSPDAATPYSNVDDLQAVMRAAGVAHAVIVGSSNGGGVAIDFTLAHPSEVDRLIVVGPEVSGIPHSKRFMERGTGLLERMARGDLRGALKDSWAFAPGDDENIERLVKLEVTSPDNIKPKTSAAPPPPAAPRLGEIKVPTLVLIGEDDAADNQAEAGMVEYAIHGARRVVIPNAGHLVYWEQPAEFTDLVTRFVEDLPSPGTEDALRRLIGEFQRGAPDYSRMSPPLAAVVRSQIDVIKRVQNAQGALKSITFKGVGADDEDVFAVAYENGSGETRIALDEEGRVMDVGPGHLP